MRILETARDAGRKYGITLTHDLPVDRPDARNLWRP
jgi:hypothetical protein